MQLAQSTEIGREPAQGGNVLSMIGCACVVKGMNQSTVIFCDLFPLMYIPCVWLF